MSGLRTRTEIGTPYLSDPSHWYLFLHSSFLFDSLIPALCKHILLKTHSVGRPCLRSTLTLEWSGVQVSRSCLWDWLTPLLYFSFPLFWFNIIFFCEASFHLLVWLFIWVNYSKCFQKPTEPITLSLLSYSTIIIAVARTWQSSWDEEKPTRKSKCHDYTLECRSVTGFACSGVSTHVASLV